jgi:tRNA pseudouridine55 synthase
VVINKPAGLSSREVVDRIVRLVDHAKVGHAGTLDPLATGLLIVCIGKTTRLVEMLHQLPKLYRATILLGARSETLDADSRIILEADAPVPSAAEVQSALLSLVGEVSQTPPAYSALKTGGRRAYELARMGHAVDLAARTVRIDRISVLRYSWPLLDLEIECGSGTYVRSIARDIGDCLKCGGLLNYLVRTRIGPFGLEFALDFSALESTSIAKQLRSPLAAVPGLLRVVLERSQLNEIQLGRAFPAPRCVDPVGTAGPVALIDSAGQLAALGELDRARGLLHPGKVLI